MLINEVNNPLPSDISAEQIILGAIFIDNRLFPFVKEKLKPEYFYSPVNRNIFKYMQRLYDAGLSINPIQIGNEAKRDGYVFPMGVAQISSLTVGMMHYSEEELLEWVTLVFKKGVARVVIKECNLTIAEALEEEYDADDLVERHETRMLAVINELYDVDNREKPGYTSLADMEPKMIEHFSDLSQGKAGGIPTGISQLDAKLEGGGLQPKGAYYFGALPKLGKTSLTLRIAKHVAKHEGRTALVASAEMHKLSLSKRLYSPEVGIPYSEFRPGFGGDNLQKAIEGLPSFGKMKVHVSDSIFTLPDLRRYNREMVMNGKRLADKYKDESYLVGLAVVDYLQLFSMGAMYNPGKKSEEVMTISREIKMMANELNIAVIGITSLNSGPMTEKREPQIGDAGWSKSIVYDAEAIWFLHSPNYLDDGYEPAEIEDIEFIMKVQRNGPPTRFNMKFYGEFMEWLTDEEFAALEGFKTSAARVQHEEDHGTLFKQTVAAPNDMEGFWK